jgi:CubicO group peptidase (beta-lactamase class C family)
MTRHLILVFAVVASTVCPSIASPSDPLPRADPETVGMSSARLQRIDDRFKADVENGRIPGAVVAIARQGKLVYFKPFGYRDKAGGSPMTTDAILSIASMTKPFVSVGTMMLFEDGRLTLGDPVAKYIPQLGKMTVATARGNVAPGTQLETVAQQRPMTVQDLLRHTSGLLYGGRGTTPLHKQYPTSSTAVGLGMTQTEFIDKLATLPLAYQPGTVWDYSLATDVLGVVVENIAGEPLGRMLSSRLFVPLKMTDTGFLVPPEKASRYARPLPLNPITGSPQPMPLDATKPTKFECGGACGVSTAGDYLRFAQMLLNEGTLDGVRVLAPRTVQYMVIDHLGAEIENNVQSVEPQRAGYGFGLGFAVRRESGVASTVGSPGDYFWNGVFGTAFWVDPKAQLVAVLMMQAPGSLEIRQQYRQLLSAFVYQAIER